MQGESVIKGLLADTRKQYSIRACIGYEERQHEMEADVKRIQSLDPERITIHFVNIDDVHSCTTALEGADGAFVLTDFYKTHPQEGEELEVKHTRTIIDACHQSTTVRHIVLSTLESADDVNNELQDCAINDNGGMLDAKARMAAYARAKNISVTYVLMPVYSESFFRTMAEKIREGREGAKDGKMNIDKADDSVNESDVLSNKDERVVCISIDDLGPAVANIFDSYEVYAGHEIGLITDVLSFSEANDIIRTVFFETKEDAELGSIPESLDQSSYSTSSPASLAMLAQSECRVVDTFPKDLGNIFRAFSKTELVKQRHLVAKTMELVPDAKPFRLWLEENRDNTEFREMLGLR